jgi:hypothetical protein
VTNPTESILVTSSYVKVPPTDTLPLKVADVPVTDPTVILGVPVSPCAVDAVPVKVPVTVIPLGNDGAPVPSLLVIISTFN